MQTLGPELASHTGKPRAQAPSWRPWMPQCRSDLPQSSRGDLRRPGRHPAARRRGPPLGLQDHLLRPPAGKHVGLVTGLAIAPDGRHAATCSEEKPLKIWNLPDPAR
jgi:hypothetical protein